VDLRDAVRQTLGASGPLPANVDVL
jgi:hypothetical protein